MKKAIAVILAMIMVFPVVLANYAKRERLDDATIPNFRVMQTISPSEDNEVVVLTVRGGQRGYVVIMAKTESDANVLLAKAKALIYTEPQPDKNPTRFALVRARV